MLNSKAAIHSAVAIMLGGITLAVFGVLALMHSAQQNAILEEEQELYAIPETIVSELGIDEDVHGYLKEYVGISSFGDEVFCSFEVLGSEEKDSELYLYLWTLCSELYVAGGEIKEGGGVSQPLVLIVSQDGSSYSVVSHREPERGANYASSARALFPEQYHSKVLPNEAPFQEVNDRHKILSQWVRERGEEYYGLSTNNE